MTGLDLPRNAFKAALLAGQPQIGLWCQIADSNIAEMLAGTGYDWMLFDGEHSVLDATSMLPLLQAVAPYPVSPVVRPTSLNPAEIKKLLDIGAQSIIVPYVQTVEEAELAAAAVAYAPAGIRGVSGISRATRFGRVPDYARRAREEICLILQIETVAALDRIEAIAAVKGVDGLFVGPADLAASLGHPGQIAHPEVRAAVTDALRRIRAAGKPAGFLALDDGYLAEAVAAGSQFTAVDIDVAILRNGASARAAAWKARV